VHKKLLIQGDVECVVQNLQIIIFETSQINILGY